VQKPRRTSKESSRCLYSIAERQAGFFTTKQAQSAGFSAGCHTYHVGAGNWVREHRGIYRLRAFPAMRRPELMRWHLWAMNRAGRAQGVYSHSTALYLHLAPQNLPRELHMTVPGSFRRSSATPEGLVLHHADLAESDIAARNGYKLTTPLRTILDLAAVDMVPRATLSKALMQIAERGMITRGQVKSARIPAAARLQLEELLRWKKR
jgi:predicted transcriptional regulator of viral defense system